MQALAPERSFELLRSCGETKKILPPPLGEDS
jgi:hypothetical protein